MVRRYFWQLSFAITLFMLANPMGRLVELAFNDAVPGQSDTKNTASYQISLPLVMTAVDERPYLMVIYDGLNGDAWWQNQGWGTDSSYCTWYGVTCDPAGHVTQLDLGYNGVIGPLSPEIGKLVDPT